VEKKRSFEVEFTWCYAGVQRSLYAYILSLIPNVADADDVMQETAAILFERMNDYDPNKPFLNWAMTFARFQSLKFRKYSARHRARTVALSDAAYEAVAKMEEFDWGDETQRLEALHKCLAELSPDARHLLEYRYSKDHTVHEIGGDDKRLASRLYKRLRRLRELLGKCVRQRMVEAPQ
jgi:RNA polymerase sigma-70 factor, ECF subfamily